MRKNSFPSWCLQYVCYIAAAFNSHGYPSCCMSCMNLMWCTFAKFCTPPGVAAAISSHAFAMLRVGQNHIIYRYIRCTYGIFSKKITIHTVIYGADIRLWPTVVMLHVMHEPKSLLLSFAVEELYGTRYRSGSFSLIYVGSGFHCMRSFFLFFFFFFMNLSPCYWMTMPVFSLFDT